MTLIGHNGGPTLDQEYDTAPTSSRWIAFAVDARTHELVGFGQDVKRADPSRGSFSRGEAWIDLLCEAGWKERKVVSKGKVVALDRGQLLSARGWLAKRWNWTEKQVRIFIEKLELRSMVSTTGPNITDFSCSKPVQQKDQQWGQQKGQQKSNAVSVLTICNYDIYQTARELDDLLKGPAKWPATGQQIGQPGASEGPELLQGIPRVQEREREISLGASADREQESLFGKEEAKLSSVPSPSTEAGSPGRRPVVGNTFISEKLSGQGEALNGVEVNCVAINGPGFSLPFDAIDLTSSVLGLSPDKGRAAAEAQARAWDAQGLVPKHPIALLTAALRSFAEGEKKAAAKAKRLEKLQAKAAAEGVPEPKAEAHPLPDGDKWFLPRKWGAWAVEKRGLDREQVLFIADNFKRYYTSEDCPRPKWREWEKVWQKWVDRAITRGDVLKAARKTAADLDRPEDMPEPIWQGELTRMVRAKEVSRQDAVAAGWMGA